GREPATAIQVQRRVIKRVPSVGGPARRRPWPPLADRSTARQNKPQNMESRNLTTPCLASRFSIVNSPLTDTGFTDDNDGESLTGPLPAHPARVLDRRWPRCSISFSAPTCLDFVSRRGMKCRVSI